ncbi:hypothetical protein GO003_018590 [Methylicorpusculum oleiharenae]|uniref:hypothetical protein n=1 Tax=Methylicorpusculum oleiharenae TaxID=1338687 RepID=UPI00135BAEBC|nr:hypothetical protein [Methylicorpusculum oleiharenae]MCD2452398.1 hypothetical protein [Methylicorpusculum oleiharenae]
MKSLWKYTTNNIISSVIFNNVVFAALITLLSVFIFWISTLFSIPNFRIDSCTVAKFYCEKYIQNGYPQYPKIKIFVPSSFIADDLCDRFSSNAALTKNFSSVHAEWNLSALELGQSIFEQRFDLLEVRPDDIDIINTGYQKIAYFPPYEAYLISIHSMPELNAAYLMGKTLGLLQNINSRSGYRVPINLISKIIDPKELTIKRYGSHEELRKALENSEVDLIGSFWGENDIKGRPSWHALEIIKIPNGMSWFLTKRLFDNQEVRCEIINHLEFLARKNKKEDAESYIKDKLPDPYFADLEIVPEAKCDH